MKVYREARVGTRVEKMSSYDQDYQRTPQLFGAEPAPLLMAHLDRLPVSARVLDIGVGQGRNAFPLIERGHRVIGIDPSAVAIEMLRDACRARGQAIELWQGSVFDYQQDETSLDAILLFGLLQILAPEQVDALLARIEGWAAPGALLLITAWHIGDPGHAVIQTSWPRIGAQSFRRADGEVRSFFEANELPRRFPTWRVIHHWEGLGPEHRHGDGPTERHGDIELVLQKR